MTVLIILAVLFIALVVIVPLIERSNFRMSGEQMGKMGRWILPLLVIMVVIQLVMYYVN
ncbi:hypothetical protein [Paraglaciecola arctica]|uniref:Uncharacterized protein n=1 Tax=Paraglaciecola arctica BSs20135 TaxID=493475 RepID=K6YQ07_9ALTE|nr:hypothetical protein [Paraglaciecola arctica]GAC18728.1 hypothetical protein GARC_1756 [Paraglaciecola arctica BSs20135]|tara:strand:- start:1347 stop:1523 length:177 start_codon:yes stop_codon:yes gene_type:complete